MPEPEIKDDELYLLLRHGKVDEFNERIAAGVEYSLVGADLRGIDLRKLNAKGLEFIHFFLIAHR